MEPVVIWNPSSEGPKVWNEFDSQQHALAYLSGVCSTGSHVAAVFDLGHSIVVMAREQIVQEAA